MSQSGAHFSMGAETFRVPMSMHAGARQRLLERLRRRGVPERAVVLLQGADTPYEFDTDRDLPFLQESFFQYLFGVKEAGFFGALEVATGRATLFMPRLPEAWAVWMGRIHPPEHVRALYEVDEVRFVDDMTAALRDLRPDVLLLVSGRNTDSDRMVQPAAFAGIEGFRTDTALLHPEIVECRVVKSEDEVALLRWVNGVSSDAHVAVMRHARPGMMEYQLEARFLHEVYDRGGCRLTAYNCICGCGPNSSVLHYLAPHGRRLADGDLFLNDSGAEYHGYASDITCTFPVNGRFTQAQRDVYDAVLAANRAVQARMGPGVSWPDMHRLAERVVAERLRDMGLLKGSVDELLARHATALFMPHGLGHLMGLDVHDPGGYPAGVERIDEPALRSLRCGRTLEAGMVITVEPGIYFIDALLEPALADPEMRALLVPEAVERFRGFGGVRIEDDVLVTAAGADNLTRVPRETAEIESVMAGGAW